MEMIILNILTVIDWFFKERTLENSRKKEKS